MEPHADSLVCPFCEAKAPDEGVCVDAVCPQARPEEAAEEGKPQVRATRAAAAVHEDAIGVDCGRRHTRTGLFLAHAVEESDGKGGAISDAGGRGRGTGEDGKEAVQGAHGDRGGLTEQIVEQVVSVFRAERPGANTLYGRNKGVSGRPGA